MYADMHINVCRHIAYTCVWTCVRTCFIFRFIVDFVSSIPFEPIINAAVSEERQSSLKVY